MQLRLPSLTTLHVAPQAQHRNAALTRNLGAEQAQRDALQARLNPEPCSTLGGPLTISSSVLAHQLLVPTGCSSTYPRNQVWRLQRRVGELQEKCGLVHADTRRLTATHRQPSSEASRVRTSQLSSCVHCCSCRRCLATGTVRWQTPLAEPAARRVACTSTTGQLVQRRVRVVSTVIGRGCRGSS